MTTITVAGLLQQTYPMTQANFYIIHASHDDYPMVDYITHYIKQHIMQLGNCDTYTFNADRYFNLTTIYNLIRNQSLFAETTYIEIRYKTKPTQEQQAVLIALIPQLGKNVFLLILTEKLTKKDTTAKWINNDSNTLLLGITNFDYASIIKHRFLVSGLLITPQALDMLLNLNRSNASELLQTVNKIILHSDSANSDSATMTATESNTHNTKQKSSIINAISTNKMHTIDVEDIKTLTTNNSRYNIYQLSEAYLRGDLTSAITILNYVYQTTEDAILIAWIIAEDLRKLIKLKNKLKQNCEINQACYDLKIMKTISNNFIQAERRLNYKQLLVIFDLVATLDMVIKGIIANKNTLQLVQQIILHLTEKPN